MPSNRTIIITGVTGNQGGAVAQALQGAGFHLRGLTRKPDSDRAAALARHGVDIVKGDLDDEATLRRALAGAWGVFGVQNAGEAGDEKDLGVRVLGKWNRTVEHGGQADGRASGERREQDRQRGQR